MRVVVADDSSVVRQYLVFLLEAAPGVKVVGEAVNGRQAVDLVQRLQPDVVLMDAHMPAMDGYQATREIMARFPTPIVMMSASLDERGLFITFEALRAGALAVVDKPPGLEHPGRKEAAERLITTLRLMSEVRLVRRRSTGDPGPAHAGAVRTSPAAGAGPGLARPPMARQPGSVRLVAIGASTGGPGVLAEVLGQLPPDLGLPVLVVQHMATGFTAGLVQWLAGCTPLRVKLAEPGEVCRPGTVLVAPEEAQMGVHPDGRILLSAAPGQEPYRPSASFLFASVAESYGPQGMGVLLTGMGRDGVLGLLRLRQAGGVTVAQDAETSPVYGMPGEAAASGAAEYVLTPPAIAELIRELAPRRSKPGD